MPALLKINSAELNETHRILKEGGFRQVTEATYSESTKITTVYYADHDQRERCFYILEPTCYVQAT